METERKQADSTAPHTQETDMLTENQMIKPEADKIVWKPEDFFDEDEFDTTHTDKTSIPPDLDVDNNSVNPAVSKSTEFVFENSDITNATPGPMPINHPTQHRYRETIRKRHINRKGKIGIIGAKQTGKTFLFQAILDRISAGEKSGALNIFFKNGGIVRLYEENANGDEKRSTVISEYVEKYRQWYRLDFTRRMEKRWFHLHLPYRRSGLLSASRAELVIEHLEASGEGFFQNTEDPDNKPDWARFLGVGTIIMCLPLWVAFPDNRLNRQDARMRHNILKGFERVLNNLIHLYREKNQSGKLQKTRCVLALTMADDERQDQTDDTLQTIREEWISGPMEDFTEFNQRLSHSSGLLNYLQQAFRVSQMLKNKFIDSPSNEISGIPSQLKEFGKSEPLFIPISAIDGKRLEKYERAAEAIAQRHNGDENILKQKLEDHRIALKSEPPQPVHVELPLLIALDDATNAFM